MFIGSVILRSFAKDEYLIDKSDWFVKLCFYVFFICVIITFIAFFCGYGVLFNSL